MIGPRAASRRFLGKWGILGAAVLVVSGGALASGFRSASPGSVPSALLTPEKETRAGVFVSGAKHFIVLRVHFRRLHGDVPLHEDAGRGVLHADQHAVGDAEFLWEHLDRGAGQ